MSLLAGFLEGIEDDAPRNVEDFHTTESRRAHTKHIQTVWTEYCEDMKQSEAEPFSNYADPANALIQGGEDTITFSILCGFVRFFAMGLSGNFGRRPHLNTVLGALTTFKFLYLQQTATIVSNELSDEVIRYIKTTVKDEFSLATPTKTRLILTKDAFKALLGAFLAPEFTCFGVRTRFQMMWFTVTATVQTLRRGAFLPVSNKVKDQNHLKVEDITVTINDAQGSDFNRISFSFPAANGKTRDSAHLIVDVDWTDGPLYCNAPFLLLVLAEISEILPEGWTVARILDPATPAQTLRLKAKSPNDPLLCGRSGLDESNELVPWCGARVNHYLDVAAPVANLCPPPTCHTLRRTGAVWLKEAGMSSEELTRQLTHKWGGFTLKFYTARVLMVDGVEVMGGSRTLGELLDLHPDKIRSESWYPKLLDLDDRADILEEPSLIAARDHVSDLKQLLFEEHGVSSTGQLPSEAYHQLDLAWGKVRALYKRSKKRVVAQKWAQVVNHEVDNYPAGEDYPDDYPAGEDVDFDVDVAEEFLTTADLSSGTAALVNAVNSGAISATAEDLDRLRDQFGSHADEGSRANPPPVAQSSASAAPAPEPSAPSAPDQPQTDVPAQGAEPSLPQPEGPGDDNDFAIDFSPLSKAWEGLCTTPANLDDVLRVFDLCTKIPRYDHVLFGYRPGYAPVDDHCPVCNKAMAELIEEPPKDDMYNHMRRRRCRAHIDHCAASSALAEIEPTLLQRYPHQLARNPFTGNLFQGDRLHVTRLTPVITRLIKPSKWDISTPFPLCEECPEKPVMYSHDLACAHLLVEHGVWVPSVQNKVTGPLTSETAKFPSPLYFTTDSSYHADPCEAESFSRTILQDRVLTPAAQRLEPYSLRSDIRINPEILTNDRHGTSVDTKYSQRSGRGGLVLREALCIFCANDERLSARSRVCTGAVPITHKLNCLVQRLRDIAETLTYLDKNPGKPVPPRGSYLVTDAGKIQCPDQACQRHGRILVDVCELLRHLVAVHEFSFIGCDLSKAHCKAINLDDVCPNTVEAVNAIESSKTKEKKASAKRKRD